MREIGVKAVCDGLPGTRWVVRGLGEIFPIRRGKRLPMEVLPKQVFWDFVGNDMERHFVLVHPVAWEM